MKQIVALPICFCIFFLSVFPVFAVRSITIQGNKTALLGDEEMTITASASGFTDGETIYIKGAFFQSGSTNYFGYTKSGDSWIKNSASNTSQRSVKIGEWDGTLIAKSDFSDSGYKGEGDYSFKVGFYYGSYSTVNWSGNIVTITLNEPDPTPTLTPTPTHTPIPTPTSTPNSTNTPTNSPVSTKTPTSTLSKNSPTPTGTLSTSLSSADETITFGSGSGDVLSGSTTSGNTTSEIETPKKSLKPFIFSFLFIGVGSALLVFVYYFKKGFPFKKEHDELS